MTKYKVGQKLRATTGKYPDVNTGNITGVIKKTFDPKVLENDQTNQLRYYLVEWDDGTEDVRHELDIDRFIKYCGIPEE